MTELIRPALYDAWHEIDALTSLGRPVEPGDPAGPGDEAAAAFEPARVEGPICESTDHLGEHRLPAAPPRRPRRHPRRRRILGLARLDLQRPAAAAPGHRGIGRLADTCQAPGVASPRSAR